MNNRQNQQKHEEITKTEKYEHHWIPWNYIVKIYEKYPSHIGFEETALAIRL